MVFENGVFSLRGHHFTDGKFSIVFCLCKLLLLIACKRDVRFSDLWKGACLVPRGRRFLGCYHGVLCVPIQRLRLSYYCFCLTACLSTILAMWIIVVWLLPLGYFRWEAATIDPICLLVFTSSRATRCCDGLLDHGKIGEKAVCTVCSRFEDEVLIFSFLRACSALCQDRCR